MIANHAGENLLPALLAGGTGAASVLLAVGRVRLGQLVDRLRGR